MVRCVNASILKYTDQNNETKLAFILTVRSKKLKKHSGEISFPGGKLEEGETIVEAAIRETREEIGIGRQYIEILGQFEPTITMTGFIIHPVVGVVSSTDFTINEQEVQRVLIVPLDFFKEENVLTEHPYQLGEHNLPFLSFKYIEKEMVNGKKTSTQHTIWGASAHIISRFFHVILGIKLYSDDYYRPDYIEMQKMFTTYSNSGKLERNFRTSITGEKD